MEPVKTKGSKNLERQMTEAFPNRALPDGWIGDSAHRTHASSHNTDDTKGSKPEWDGDSDNIPEVRADDFSKDLGPGTDIQDVVNWIRKLNNVETVIRYMIYNGYIYHVDNGFKPALFDGDPHRDHLHVTYAFTNAADENTTFNYRLDEIYMPSVDDIWDEDIDNTSGSYTARGALLDTTRRVDALYKDVLPDVERKIDALTAVVAEIKNAVIPPK